MLPPFRRYRELSLMTLFKSRLFLIQYAVALLVIGYWLVMLAAHQPGDGLGTDFYPIYWAGKLLLAGENPYGPEALTHFKQVWAVPFAAAGFAYPLPAVVGVLPLALLPLPLAVLLWTASGAIGSTAAIRLREDWASLLLLPFLFMPLHRAIVVKQATLVWFALVVLLLFAMRRRWAWVAGLCIALLPAKPQVGILFALAGLIWAWREHRRALPWIAGWSLLIWGTSFWLQPAWVQAWLASVALYNDIVYTASLLPWGLLLLVFTWRLPWYAQLAAAQVVLFPIADVYAGLPFLLTWVAIGGPLALVGSSISWLPLIIGLPNSADAFWATTVLPLVVCAAWRLYTAKRTRLPAPMTKKRSVT